VVRAQFGDGFRPFADLRRRVRLFWGDAV